MAINPKIAGIISEAYNQIGVIANEIAKNYDDGYGQSDRQKLLERRLVKTNHLLSQVLRYVNFDANGDYTGVSRLTDVEINKLLTLLIKIADIDNIPVAPKLFYHGVPHVIQGGSLPSDGVEGDLIYFHNGAWQRLSKGANGNVLASTPTTIQWQSVVGNGIPSGGTAGQYLNKIDATDFNVQWSTLTLAKITDITASAAEVNILDGVTASTAEINHLVGVTSAVQTQLNGKLSTTLTNGSFFVGNGSNVATAVAPTGDVTFNNGGVFSISAAVIVDADVNASAAIARTKLASGTAHRVIVNDASGVMSEQSAITASRVLISDANGLPVHSAVTTTTLGFLDPTSSIQTQLNARLTVSLTGVAQGDIVYFDGANWVNLPRGTNGQVLQSTSTTIQWGSGVANGLPAGGTDGQYLNKIDGTDYNTQWSTLTVSKITDLTATAAELNIMDGVTVTFDKINHLSDVTAPIQNQLNNKLGTALATNNLYVGNGSGVAAPTTDLPTGTTIGSAFIYRVGGSDVTLADGGTGASLVDPNYNGVMGWDNTLNAVRFFQLSGLSYDSGTNTLTATGGAPGGVTNELQKNDGAGGLDGTGLFSSADGNLTLGDSGLAGNRTIVALNSTSNALLTLSANNGATLSTLSAGGNLVDVTTTTTNTVEYNFNIRIQSTGTPANGIGTGIGFQVETAAGNIEAGGTIEVVANDVSAGAEDFSLSIKLMRDGAAATERFKLSSLLGYAGISNGVSIGNPDRQLHIINEESSTNTSLPLIRMSRKSSGTPAAGIGTGIEFQVETSAGNDEVGALIEAITTDVTAGTEDFDLSLKVMAGGASAAEQLRLTSDGRLFGKSLHNNAGSVTGTSNQYIASGTYTPTLTNVANLDASTAYECQWIRVGNVVTVSGKVDVDPNLTATSTQLGISLPIASNFGAAEDCAGAAAASAIAGQSAAILADTANDRAQMQWVAGDVTNQPHYFTFSYTVI